MTLKDASKLLGVGRETLRKAILARELPASTVNGPGGRTYTVTSHDLQQWWERWERKEVTLGTPVGTSVGTVGTSVGTVGTMGTEVVTVGTSVGTFEHAPGSFLGTVVTLGSDPVGTVGSLLGTLGTSEDAMGTLATAHIEAIKNNGRLLEELLNVQRQLETERLAKERAERMAYAIREEMGAYKRALSESAESLAEQRALLAVVKAQHHQVELTHQVQDQSKLATLKVDTTTTSRGWGSRLRRFLGVRQTG